MRVLLADIIFLFSLLVVVPFASASEDVYQKPEVFVAESFDGTVPAVQTLTLDDAAKARVAKIMGSHYRLPRVEYWLDDGRSAWILEEIGKFEPITSGFIVGESGKLERVKVLIYRESHGWEVKRKFFTRQFKGAGLKRGKKLSKRIDGIAGATLSVDALKRMSALAIMLHETVSPSP